MGPRHLWKFGFLHGLIRQLSQEDGTLLWKFGFLHGLIRQLSQEDGTLLWKFGFLHGLIRQLSQEDDTLKQDSASDPSFCTIEHAACYGASSQ